MKRFFTFTLSLLLPALLLAQSKVNLMPEGSLSGQANEVLKIRTAISSHRGFNKITPYDHSLTGLTGTIDTLRYAAPGFNWGTNFGFFGQDVMVQWFEAPADMDINAVSFTTSDDENSAVSVKLVAMAWDKDQIQATQGDLGASWWGYYEADQNGFNNIGNFMDDGDVTGGWVEKGEGEIQQWGSPFGADLWSDFGVGASATAVNGATTWVNMDLLGETPSVLAGDLIGVVVKNEGTTMDAGRTGLSANNTLGFTGFKLYKNGRLQPGVDFGWWSRLYTWAMEMAVDLTGDRAPKINAIDNLPTTLSTAARTVNANITDDNPSGGAAGVASAILNYTIDGGDAQQVTMTGTEPDFAGDIPGQAPGTAVAYWIVATDVGGLSSETAPINYKVFEQIMRTLLVMNGQGDSGYPTDFYFGHPTPYPYDHDTWAFGALTADLVNYYDDIIEITTGGPGVINNEVIRTWLEGDAERDYLLAGDEWLGVQTNWTDQDWAAGSFHYDILGITHEYNDVVDADNNRSQVLTVPGSLLGNTLDSLFNNVMVDSPLVPVDTMWYDPGAEISVTNWLDGVDVTEDSDVFLKGVGPDATVYNIGHSRTLTAGNSIAFFSYDPISLNSSPYYWFGWDQGSPHNVAMRGDFMNAATDVEDNFGEIVARKFSLAQNYPNPFNPTTTINYVLPTAEKVELTVFDLMGREVAKLVNQQQNAGPQTVTFDATNYASGMYVYTVKAGSFKSSKKMLLVK